jgi:tRNA pseudouridine38-40 synthase
MRTFKITLSYDGTGFIGWQRQAEGTSVQGLLENALGDLDGREVVVIGAGRTDAGVHALGQVASFALERVISADTLSRALNARLPASVRIVSAEEAPDGFNARFGARTKTYRYRLWHADVLNPFERCYVWHVSGALDLDGMAKAARLIEGRHDFAAFQAAGSRAATTERVIFSSCINGHSRASSPPAGLIEYEIRGNGFLRHMVRTIVGSLVEIGRGRRTPDWMADLLTSKERARAGPTAPAEGLFLVAVEY